MKKLFSFLVSFLFLAFSALALYAYHYISTPASHETGEVRFEVPAGAFYKTANALEEKGLIEDSQYFTWYARLSGQAGFIKKGEYLLRYNYSPKEILDILVSGQTIKYKVTIPEGHNIFEIAALVEQAGLVSEKDFLSYVRNTRIAQEITGLEVSSFEGFLFPETYYFSKQDTVKSIVRAMYGEFELAYQEVISGKNKINMPKLDHVILASIIEKETGVKEERGLISSVFHNRLEKGMRLQSDPTIIYGVMMEEGVWIKNIKRSHILEKTAYNTYRIAALPPGPIANPGKKSLKAVINPKDSEYLYFVSRNDGSHVFSKTYKEHLKNVKEYQLKQ